MRARGREGCNYCSVVLLFCCPARKETGGLGLREQREKDRGERSAGSLPGFLAGMPCVLAGCAGWSWGLGYDNK